MKKQQFWMDRAFPSERVVRMEQGEFFTYGGTEARRIRALYRRSTRDGRK
jgi:hypothetical protein